MGVHEDFESARNAAMASAAGFKTCSNKQIKDDLSTSRTRCTEGREYGRVAFEQRD